MTPKLKNNLLLALSATVVLFTTLLFYWNHANPISVSIAPVSNIHSNRIPDSTEQIVIPPDQLAEQELAEIIELFQTELYRPLVDPPPTQTLAIARSTFPLTLVGWVNEPAHAMAILQKPDSSLQICAVGDSIELNGTKASILSIAPSRVTLRYGAETHELLLKTPGAPND